MGGRRAGSLDNLVGVGGAVTQGKSALSRAVTSEDPHEIASASARLVAQSDIGLEALRLGLKLVPYLERNQGRLAALPKVDREEEIRRAWSSIKHEHVIDTSSEVDNAVITSAREAFALSEKEGK